MHTSDGLATTWIWGNYLLHTFPLLVPAWEQNWGKHFSPRLHKRWNDLGHRLRNRRFIYTWRCWDGMRKEWHRRQAVQICQNRNLNVKVVILNEQKYPTTIWHHRPQTCNRTCAYPIELWWNAEEYKSRRQILLLTPNVSSTAHKISALTGSDGCFSTPFSIFTWNDISRYPRRQGCMLSPTVNSQDLQFVWLASYLNRKSGKSFTRRTIFAARIKSRLFSERLRMELVFNESVGRELEVVAPNNDLSLEKWNMCWWTVTYGNRGHLLSKLSNAPSETNCQDWQDSGSRITRQNISFEHWIQGYI